MKVRLSLFAMSLLGFLVRRVNTNGHPVAESVVGLPPVIQKVE
jgi:hypothetical protein